MDKRTDRPPFDVTPETFPPRARRAKGWVPSGMRVLVIAVAILLVAGLVWALRPSQTAPRAANRPGGGANQASPVGIAKVVAGDIDVTINGLGTVTPLATVTVKPQVSGQLAKIDFTEGQLVQAGQAIAQVDPKPYQAARDQAEGQLARDQAQLANAEVDLTRYRTLIAENSIAQQQVDTQQALVRQLEGVVKSDQANVESAQINLAYTAIVSPISGRVGLRQVDLGNLVTAGQANSIVTVTQLQPISVVFSVPEDSINDIMSQVNAKATMTTDAYDRGQTMKLATGTLSTVDNQIDTATGTVKLRAMFDNSKGELFPNQFVNIKLFVKTLHNQITVPSAAIQRGAAGAFVFVVNADHTVNMRTVTPGQTQDDRVAVTSGLKVGETVVVDGADRLREGAKVQLPGETAPPVVAQQGRGPNAGRGRRGGAGGGGNAGAGNTGAAANPAGGAGRGGGG
jgi:membrane fusion protein, multidrug efflux system